MKKVLFLLSTAAIFFAGCSEDSYEVNLSNDIKTKVDGYVYNAYGDTDEPLADVTVTISGKEGKSDAEGYFSVDGLSVGEYCVKYEKEGFTTILNCGVQIEASNFYGDQKQTFTATSMYPKDKSITISFVYYDVVDAEYKPVSAAVTAEFEYEEEMLFDDIADQPLSNGTVALTSIPATEIYVHFDQFVGEDEYICDAVIPVDFIEKGAVKILCTRIEDAVSNDDYDISGN